MAEVLWHGPDQASELCRLEEVPDGFLLSGTAFLAHEGAPVEATYAVRVDRGWRTEDVDVVVRFASGDTRRPFASGSLWSGADRPPEYEGCADVDLGFSPSTNTLPIRRLRLGVGESADVVVAWLRWPELTVEPSEQRYERLARDRYLFASGTFRAELVVDPQGLVLDYEGHWRAVAHAPEERNPLFADDSSGVPQSGDSRSSSEA